MQITIEFNSIWQNSFLEDIDSKKRKFIATSKARGIQIDREITKNTILGVLSRLIGDQRPLKLARESNDFYFKAFEKQIQEPKVQYTHKHTENVMLLNKSETRPSQKTFIGVIADDTELFFSSTAPQLWSILYLDIQEIFNFILNDECLNKKGDSKPLSIISRLDNISKLDNIKVLEDVQKEIRDKMDKESKKKRPDSSKINLLNSELQDLSNGEKQDFYKSVQHIMKKLKKIYPTVKSFEKNEINLTNLYVAALYIQASRMKSQGYNLNYCYKEEELVIHGFPKESLKFNGVRDFLNKFSGKGKRTSKTPVNINKSSGQVSIILDIPREKAKELKLMIENAGVSSFYLGKKGLAYVTNIDTREVQK